MSWSTSPLFRAGRRARPRRRRCRARWSPVHASAGAQVLVERQRRGHRRGRRRGDGGDQSSHADLDAADRDVHRAWRGLGRGAPAGRRRLRRRGGCGDVLGLGGDGADLVGRRRACRGPVTRGLRGLRRASSDRGGASARATTARLLVRGGWDGAGWRWRRQPAGEGMRARRVRGRVGRQDVRARNVRGGAGRRGIRTRGVRGGAGRWDVCTRFARSWLMGRRRLGKAPGGSRRARLGWRPPHRCGALPRRRA